MATILEVQGLKKYFNVPAGFLHAVDDVNFSIEEGHTLGVVGESGCGKSTLGRVLVHLLESTGGKIFYRGEDITKVNTKKVKELRKKMQMIFQDPYSSLDPRKTIYQTISEVYKLNTDTRGAELEERVYEMMDLSGLARRLRNTYPHELDGGRRQRIGIARALALRPEFIVCDEPVSALDVSIQAQILNLMLDLQDRMGLTYIFITHDLSVVKYISHQILVMYLGQVVEFANTDALFAHPLHPYTQALLSAVPEAKLTGRRERIILKGELTSPVNPKPGCRFAKRCLYASDKCFSEQPEFKQVSDGHYVACHNV